jgi:Skp family chaperone for outer membrane proteins
MLTKLHVSVSILLAMTIAWLVYRSTQNPGIAYVRSADLIYGYNGMKEAQQKQQQKTEELNSGLDTLKMQFQKAVSQYNTEFASLPKNERSGREQILGAQQENIRRYSQNIQQEIEANDKQLTEGVLNQVNAFVETYAKEKGYDVVLGTTNSGNILYGRESMDITKEVLEAINADYTRHPKQPATQTLTER